MSAYSGRAVTLTAIALISATIFAGVTIARGADDDRYPHLEASSARKAPPAASPRRGYNSRRHQSPRRAYRPRPAASEPSAAVQAPAMAPPLAPPPNAPAPWDRPAAPPASRFDDTFGSLARSPIIPVPVRTVPFRAPAVQAPAPPPKAPIFLAILIGAAIAGLALFAAIRAFGRTKWQRLKRSAHAPPRSAVILQLRGRRKRLA